MGVGNAAPVGGLRGEVVGWSAASVRRHKRWLYGIEAPRLDGIGEAVTLTMLQTPVSHSDWQNLLSRLFQRLRDAGFLRWHWVVEWQRRGTPHLHLAVYAPAELGAPGRAVTRMWLDLTAESYGARAAAQYVTPITGAVGWLKYLSKHASRGVAHYQRQGKPAGWDKTGRLWGYGGDWPSAEPVQGVLTQAEYHRVRRMVRGYAIAQARSAALGHEAAGDYGKARAAWRSVGWLRTMLACNDRGLSSVRGVSEWVPGPVLVDMAFCAGWAGELADLVA
jgi:hypothetical protein